MNERNDKPNLSIDYGYADLHINNGKLVINSAAKNLFKIKNKNGLSVYQSTGKGGDNELRFSLEKYKDIEIFSKMGEIAAKSLVLEKEQSLKIEAGISSVEVSSTVKIFGLFTIECAFGELDIDSNAINFAKEHGGKIHVKNPVSYQRKNMDKTGGKKYPGMNWYGAMKSAQKNNSK